MAGQPGKMPAGSEDKPMEAKGGEDNLLDWLIRPFPNSPKGNGLPGAVTKRPMANKPSGLHRCLPGSVKVIPAFMIILLKAENW